LKIITIGREPNNIILLNDPTVSRNHGILEFHQNDDVFFEDLNSSNGSFINGNRIYGKVQLRNTDILKVGKSLVPWQDYRVSNHTQNPSESSKDRPPYEENGPFSRTTENSGNDDDSDVLDNLEQTDDSKTHTSLPQNGCLGKKSVFLTFLVFTGVVIASILFINSTKSGASSKLDEEYKRDTVNTQISQSTPPEQEEQRLVFSDRDSDGINDDKDRCPDEAGPESNKGCPSNNSTAGNAHSSNYTYRTQCPYCNELSYENRSDVEWTCGSCGMPFYNCYTNSSGNHDGIKLTWVGDGTCDCSLTCSDEKNR